MLKAWKLLIEFQQHKFIFNIILAAIGFFPPGLYQHPDNFAHTFYLNQQPGPPVPQLPVVVPRCRCQDNAEQKLALLSLFSIPISFDFHTFLATSSVRFRRRFRGTLSAYQILRIFPKSIISRAKRTLARPQSALVVADHMIASERKTTNPAI